MFETEYFSSSGVYPKKLEKSELQVGRRVLLAQLENITGIRVFFEDYNNLYGGHIAYVTDNLEDPEMPTSIMYQCDYSGDVMDYYGFDFDYEDYAEDEGG